ncbi:C2 calcium-dependent domain-containing protein 4C [Odontesthes bonariensis]|uniref:C2 calcium-dependent domain-containing protein 4C n=1 Tax=Odontesthes bonariensis TaxID=219752 RepID=UPI003F58124E
MWVLGKIRESMESIPLELNRYMEKSKEDIFFPSKTSFSQNLHSNIITPDNIPEFCLPPRLCKRSPQPEVEKTPPYLQRQSQISKASTSLKTTQTKKKDVRIKKDETLVSWKATKKPLPFSAEGYGLAGIYESPNTRRKESLFHSIGPGYMLERSVPTAAPTLAKESNLPKKTLSGLIPLFLCKSLSETGSTEYETPSSSDSSPLCSPYGTKSANYIKSKSGRLKGTVSCPSLIDNKDVKGRWKKGGLSLTTSPSTPPSIEENSSTLSPPVLFPLDILQCQERLPREHVLPLQGRGRVRLSAELATFSNNTFSALSTVRVRVVSVEGLWDQSEQHTLNCSLILCLTPGRLQQQESATIRKCRSPVFNEDFFFIELSHKDLLELQLRLKVVDKPAHGMLKRGTLIGLISKPLSELLPLKKQIEQ